MLLVDLNAAKGCEESHDTLASGVEKMGSGFAYISLFFPFCLLVEERNGGSVAVMVGFQCDVW